MQDHVIVQFKRPREKLCYRLASVLLG